MEVKINIDDKDFDDYEYMAKYAGYDSLEDFILEILNHKVLSYFDSIEHLRRCKKFNI